MKVKGTNSLFIMFSKPLTCHETGGTTGNLIRERKGKGRNIDLIAGYVKQVATHFETAPNIKAENAERACGDDSAPLLLLCCPFSTLSFN